MEYVEKSIGVLAAKDTLTLLDIALCAEALRFLA